MALSVVLTVVRVFLPNTSAAAALITQIFAPLTIAAIVVGIRRNKPERTLPWVLLLIMMIVATTGNLIFTASLMRGDLPPFPSLADVFWLACYPIELVAVMLLVDGHSWRRDRAGILDTLMVTGGLGLAMWLLLLRHLVGPAMAWDTRLVTMAYPLADLLMIAAMVRMCISSARRSPAFWMLVGYLGVESLAHFGAVWLSAHGNNQNQLAPLFLLATMLLGCAALHPSMVTVGDRSPRAAVSVTRLRVMLIGSACLLSPVLLIVDGIVEDGRVDWLAASICCIVVFLLVIARMVGLIRIVQDQANQLESMAYLDALTGIPNRRAWDAEIERRLAVARRSGDTLIVGLIDIDHFKKYNDLLGHPAGDELLRTAAAAWHGQLRPEDLIARYGGEEFGLILHCRLRDAAIVMERLREVTPDGQTFSAGLAQWTGDESALQLTTRVDAALYTAKREGRDQYSVTGNPMRTDLQADFLVSAGAGSP